MDTSGEKPMENSMIPIFILDPLSFVMCLCRLSVFSLEFAIVEHWVWAIFPAIVHLRTQHVRCFLNIMCFGSVVPGTGGAWDNVGFVHLPVQIPKTFSHQAPKSIQVNFRFSCC